jgi:aspartyl-tRNA(Asn)/glutamyl-tRNA(Gln) amidotransferase subunit B
MFEPVIGLEVHAQLLTRSKAFCSCSTEFGLAPNTNTCPICLGHPGALPVVNRRLVEFIVRMGLATGCSIRERSTFARKNYFYPDLPKGYQISQFDDPICYGGVVEIEMDQKGEDGLPLVKRIGITRIHMEEDAGKSIHDLDADTLVDLNRSGVPLIEIVSEPDIRSAAEATAYLKELRRILMALEICDGNMEEGSLRCDVNISVRQRGVSALNPRMEIKNLNSFKSVEGAITFEIERQSAFYTELLQRVNDAGISLAELAKAEFSASTARFDVNTGKVTIARSKEAAHDYRYFPEPDLVPVVVNNVWKNQIARLLPELPLARKRRLVREYGLPVYDAAVLTEDLAIATYFEDACTALTGRTPEAFKLVSNWLMTEVLRVLQADKITIAAFPVPAAQLAELVDLITAGTISGKIAKDIFPEMLTGAAPKAIVESKGLVQVSDEGVIEKVVDEILAANAGEVEKYRSGKTNLFGFFVGQTLKATQGKANPKLVNDLLRKKLG